MPVLFAVDISLSMHPYFGTKTESDSSSVTAILRSLILRSESNFHYDYLAVVYMGEEMTVAFDFTKDYQNIYRMIDKSVSTRTAKLDFAKCYSQILTHCQLSWSTSDVVQCLFVTNSTVDFNKACRELNARRRTTEMDSVGSVRATTMTNIFPVVLVFDHPRTRNVDSIDSAIRQIFDIHSFNGSIYHMEFKGNSCRKTTTKLFNLHFRLTSAQLQLGNLKCDVFISPPLTSSPCGAKEDIDEKDSTTVGAAFPPVSVSIFGFTKLLELSNPVVHSRHLFLPKSDKTVTDSAGNAPEASKVPNLCTLLHGALKVSESIALCQIEKDWFGYIMNFSSDKKSTMVLTTFKPGQSEIPWLEQFDKMNFIEYVGPNGAPPLVSQIKPTADNDTKPSYSSGFQSWVHSYGLQSDLQKVVRYMKKLPEKDTLFYAELNRILNHAISIGCIELQQYLKEALLKEKEGTSLTEAQIDHVNYIVARLEIGNLNRNEPLVPLIR